MLGSTISETEDFTETMKRWLFGFSLAVNVLIALPALLVLIFSFSVRYEIYHNSFQGMMEVETWKAQHCPDHDLVNQAEPDTKICRGPANAGKG